MSKVANRPRVYWAEDDAGEQMWHVRWWDPSWAMWKTCTHYTHDSAMGCVKAGYLYYKDLWR